MKAFLGGIASLLLLMGIALMVLPRLASAPTTATTPPAATSTDTATTATTTTESDVIVNGIKDGSTVASPLTITGKAKGSYYFEASFPIMLTDWDGRIIATTTAQASSDWMSTGYVPFTATISFSVPSTTPDLRRGTLIFHNDNPSGDHTRDKAVEIPVKF